jgi:hypothetical protein
MRTKEAITKIQNNPYYKEIAKLLKTDKETFFNQKLNAKVYPFRTSNLESEYSHGRLNWIIKNLEKHSLKFRKEQTFKFFDTEIKVIAVIEREEYSRTGEINAYYWFVSEDMRHLCYEIDTHQLPKNQKLEDLTKLFNAHFYPDNSYLGLIQRTKQCFKSHVIRYYQKTELSKKAEYLDLSKWFMRKYKVWSHELDTNEIAQAINKHGKSLIGKELKSLDNALRYAVMTAQETDGDIHEIENIYWQNCPEDTKTIAYV